MSIEVVEAFGVSIPALELSTIEQYLSGRKDDKFKNIEKLAFENHCIGVSVRKNDVIFLFLLDSSRKSFYNTVKELVKCELLTDTMQVERSMPIRKISA